MGCVTQIGEQGWNIGRMRRGRRLSRDVCGTTVDRQCGSSMQTNLTSGGDLGRPADVVVAAGVEMMSRVPMGSNGGDISDKVTERGRSFRRVSPPKRSQPSGGSRAKSSTPTRSSRTAARSRRSTRAGSRRRSCRSRCRRAGAAVLFAVDETPRRDTSAEKLASLRPRSCPTASLRPATRARSSTGRRRADHERGGGRRGSASSRAPASSRSAWPGSTLPDAARQPGGMPKALERAGLGLGRHLGDRGERGVRPSCSSSRGRGLEDRFDDINPNGGGISLGHPFGATGVR